MSASLVKKSLQLVNDGKSPEKINKKTTNVPKNQRLIQKIFKKGKSKRESINLLSDHAKLSVETIKRQLKEQNNTINEPKSIGEKRKFDLDRKTKSLLIERALAGHSVPYKPKAQKVRETVFTDEDFEKFEKEYFEE